MWNPDPWPENPSTPARRLRPGFAPPLRRRAGVALRIGAGAPKDDVVSRLGESFAPVSVGEMEAVVRRFEDAAERFGVPLDIVNMPKTSMTREWESLIVLAKPDRYVAYAGCDTQADAKAVPAVATGRRYGPRLLSEADPGCG